MRTLAVHEPEGAEILVRVVGCTLCGSDVHTFLGRRTTPLPTILGHEILGRIEAFGPTAPRSDLRGQCSEVGDRVTWTLVASCGTCFFCRHDLPQKCASATSTGTRRCAKGSRTGALPTSACSRPAPDWCACADSLSDEVACPANCATATVAAAVAAAGLLREAKVLVLGAGMLGLTACGMVRDAGAAEVVCCDIQPKRLCRAADFGSTHLASPDALPALVVDMTSGRGVDVAIDLAGTPSAFETLWPLVRLGATVVLVGAVYPTRHVRLPVEQLVRRNLVLRGVHNYTPQHLVAAVEFLETSDYPWTSLVSDWLPLEEATRAFFNAQDPATLRIGVRP